MINSRIETRTDVSPRLKYIIRMGELVNRATPVNSIIGIRTDTYPWSGESMGLSTMGLNTCNAIAGYYLRDAKFQLFMAHVQPEITPEALLGQLNLDGVEGVTLDYINGSATKPERNEQFRQAVEQFFRERHINIHRIPPERHAAMKAPPGEKIFSYGALLSVEKITETVSMPLLTVIDEV